MSRSRRVQLKIIYNGVDITHDISKYNMSFSYEDDTDLSDVISITLSDREKLWSGAWFPETGDTITVTISLFDWNFEGDNRTLDIGVFEVDEIPVSETASIKAVSVPITSSARSEKKYRVWESLRLSGIAGDIAGKAGLSLVYDTDIDPFYDRNDQNNKSDLEYLEGLCKSDGLCLKISDGQLIIFEESKYDTLPAVLDIERSKTSIIGFPSFRRRAKNIYQACEISYFDAKTDRTYTGYFKAPQVGGVGHTLRLNEKFNSETDDISLDRKAKARLREQNKNEWMASFTLKGDIVYFAGTNINVKGFNKFDGKYFIERVTHNIAGSGYTVTLDTRRCLEGY